MSPGPSPLPPGLGSLHALERRAAAAGWKGENGASVQLDV